MPASPSGEPFANPPLDLTELPHLAEETFEPLHPRYLRIRHVADAIVGVVVVIAAVVAVVALPDDVPRWIPVAVAAGLLVVLAALAWIQWLEVTRLGYLVREHDFSFRQGVISRTVTTVPFARIQHVSIDRGPLARWQGLASLRIRTAGDGIVVPGVGHDAAQRLRALVVDRAGALADEELVDRS